MQPNLTESGQRYWPVFERLHAQQLEIHASKGRADRQDDRLTRVEKDLEDAQRAIEEIKERMSAAIMWLALGAGGLLLQVIGPKLGL